MRKKDSYKKTFWHSFTAGMGFAFARAMRKFLTVIAIPMLIVLCAFLVALYNILMNYLTPFFN